jgi:hypothetical protein
MSTYDFITDGGDDDAQDQPLVEVELDTRSLDADELQQS